MKRLGSIVIMIVAILGMLSSAAAVSSDYTEADRYVIIRSCNAYAEKQGNRVYCTADADVIDGAYTIMRLYLQTATSSSAPYSDLCMMKEEIISGIGYFSINTAKDIQSTNKLYRARLTVDVYNSNNVRLDHAETFSGSC